MAAFVCIKAFGRHKPGDVFSAPDDAEMSPLYFREAPKPADTGDEKPKGSK
jgi:hypothetical protein